MERQLWRLFDLRHGGSFGLSVEFFFQVIAKLLFSAPSQDTHSALYMGTLKSISSGWRQHRGCIGTQRVILNLICDIALYERGVFSDGPNFPRKITTELLRLLEKMMEEQSGSRLHIEDAMMQLDTALTLTYKDPRFCSDAKGFFSRLSARTPS